MPRLKLTLEYDGTDFVGWQLQPNGRSVQGVVEAAVGELLGGEPTRVAAAGRTDSGVHARGQVVSLATSQQLPLKAWARGLNSLLPSDVAVVRAEEVPEEFDPRRWSLGKRYRYRISNRTTRSPLRRRTHWELFGALDLEAMREGAVQLRGRHDFAAFRAANCEARSSWRELRRVEVEGEAGEEVCLVVEGTAFLKHMVRNLVGTLVEVGRGRQGPAWVKEVLGSKDRRRAGVTAPAQGLTLEEVFYGPGRPVHLSPEDVADE